MGKSHLWEGLEGGLHKEDLEHATNDELFLPTQHVRMGNMQGRISRYNISLLQYEALHVLQDKSKVFLMRKMTQ